MLGVRLTSGRQTNHFLAFIQVPHSRSYTDVDISSGYRERPLNQNDNIKSEMDCVENWTDCIYWKKTDRQSQSKQIGRWTIL